MNKYGMSYGRNEILSVAGAVLSNVDIANVFFRAAETLERSRCGFGTESEKSWTSESVLAAIEKASESGGTFIDPKSFVKFGKLDEAGESEVYHIGGIAIKVNSFSFVDSAFRVNEFLDRLVAHNEFAPDVAYTIVGFTRNGEGDFSIVLSQPFIKGEHPCQIEIDEDMGKRGFLRKMVDADEEGQTEGWSNGVFDLWDTKPANVIKDSNGEFHYIDTVIQHSVIPNHANPNRF